MGRPPDHAFTLEGRPTAGASERFGDSLAASFADGTLRIYGTGGDVRRAWTSGAQGFTALAFSGDGRRIAGGGRDGRVVLAEAGTGREIASFAAQEGRVGSLSVSDDGSVVAAAADTEVRAFRAETGRRLFALASSVAEVTDAAVAPAGDRVAVAFTDVDVRLVDAASGRVALTISDFDMAVFSLAYSKDGRLLACGCADGCVSIRDAATGARVRADIRHAEPVGAVAFSADGSRVTSVGISMNPGTREASARTTSVSGGAAETDVLGVVPFASVGFSAGGTAHVASPGPGGVRVWDVPPRLRP